jgi:hypothetical protein
LLAVKSYALCFLKYIRYAKQIIPMKGVAAWIWVIMGVVLGILVLVFGSTLLLQQVTLTQKQLVLGEFQDFSGKLKTICIEGGIGEVYYYKMTIPENTRAMYVTNASDASPPDKVSDYITKSKSAVGNYFCMQFVDENLPRCSQISCYSSFTYIGTPSLKPTLQSILARLGGQSPVYDFIVFVNKTDYNFLSSNATQTIGSVGPSSNTATEPPSVI